MAETVRIEIPIEALDNTDPALSQIISKLGKMENASKQAQSSVSKTSQTVSKFDQSANKTQKTLSNWMKQKYQLLLEAKDKISPILNTLKSGLKTVTSKAWKVTMKAVDMVTAPVRGIINLFKNPLFQVGAVLGISVGLADTINTFADFQASMSNVEAISGATRQEMQLLTAKAKEMGRSTSKTAKDAADGLGYMALAGWDTQTMLKSIYPTLRLSEAGNMDLARTSDLVTDSMSSLAMKADELPGYLDKIAKTAASSNTNIDALMEAFVECGGTINNMNIPLSEASALFGVMANRGTKGSEAGNAFNSVLTNLTMGAGQAGEAMKKLGLSAFDSTGKFKGYANVLKELNRKLKGMNDEQKSYYLNAIGGKMRASDLQKMLAGVADEYDELYDKIENSNGALERMARTMQDNLKGSITRFQSALEGVKLTLGEQLEPYLRDFVDWLTGKMPLVEDAIIITMNKIKSKVAEVKKTIQEFTGTDEWKNADFFGKVKIAWDKIIAEPFMKWWNTTGKGMFANVARSIGHGIGSGISMGLLTLLGIKVEDGINDGVSIGKSFAEGFMSGFNIDAIKDKLGGLIKSIFSSAAKILPGGEQAGLSSFLSAMLIGKIAGAGLKLGRSGANLGRTIFGSGVGGSGGLGLGTTLLGSASQGTGLFGLGSMTAIKLGAGNLAGGASMSAGALSTIGLGSIAGGVVGGATLISGGIDLYKGFKKAASKEEATAYKKSGAWKIGGVGSGAAIGASLGAAFGGIGAIPGALIGAGIGGIAGWIKGDSVKKEYEEQEEAARKAAKQARIVKEQAKYNSMELKAAIADTSTTVDEFMYLFQKAVGKDLQSRFGDLKLSMLEIQDVAKKIVFDKAIESAGDFAEAVNFAEGSLASLESSVQAMKKLNWKAGLGLKFEEADIESYKTSIEELIVNAKNYVEDKHYETTMAIKLLASPDDIDLSIGLNEMYSELQEQIDTISNELTIKIGIALEDGIISPDEQKEIQDLQKQLTDITDMFSNAQIDATFDATKLKYSGSDLTVDTYAQMMQEIQRQTEVLAQEQIDAYQKTVSSLNVRRATGKINDEEYKDLKEAAEITYTSNMDNLQKRVNDFGLNTLVETFSKELDGVLPELEGTTSEKLNTMLRSILASGIDIEKLDTETFSKILGIDKLGLEVQANITDMLKQTAAIISSTDTGIGRGIESSLLNGINQTDYNIITDTIKNVFNVPDTFDFTDGCNSVMNNLAETLKNTDMGAMIGAVNAVKINTQELIDAGFKEGFKTSTRVDIDLSANYKLRNPLPPIPSLGNFNTQISSTGIAQNATGNIINTPTLSWVGEDGAEAIIPLTSKYRSRGLSLWEQAGEALGVQKYATGGIIGNTARSLLWNNEESTQPKSHEVPYKIETQGTGKQEITVQIEVSPTFEISADGGDENKIMSTIKANFQELVDDIGGELAEKMKQVFSNMPTKA